jgi:hypothetical protein
MWKQNCHLNLFSIIQTLKEHVAVVKVFQFDSHVYKTVVNL